MEALLQRGKELGFGKEAIYDVLGMGRPLSQLAWVSSQDLGHLAQKTAMETMEELWNMNVMIVSGDPREEGPFSWKSGTNQKDGC